MTQDSYEQPNFSILSILSYMCMKTIENFSNVTQYTWLDYYITVKFGIFVFTCGTMFIGIVYGLAINFFDTIFETVMICLKIQT